MEKAKTFKKQKQKAANQWQWVTEWTLLGLRIQFVKDDFFHALNVSNLWAEVWQQSRKIKSSKTGLVTVGKLSRGHTVLKTTWSFFSASFSFSSTC